MLEEKLTAEIEKHNCLWDKRQLSYRDRVKKDLAWRNVAAAVGHPEENCRKRWKSLRDRYGIELKVHQQPSGNAASFRRTWPYFEAMLFLKDTVTPRQ
ncbi:transcription factor Adf-1-like [Rhagoletis pomonella]|uniref:transcription factor Adf-1-like n=1 Tax=Rhagoletis pomonella TaxID=28610 RepID=UPI001785098E|nr:transcription factor Adf-1-like [Rhagoletis pomonella]